LIGAHLKDTLKKHEPDRVAIMRKSVFTLLVIFMPLVLLAGPSTGIEMLPREYLQIPLLAPAEGFKKRLKVLGQRLEREIDEEADQETGLPNYAKLRNSGRRSKRRVDWDFLHLLRRKTGQHVTITCRPF